MKMKISSDAQTYIICIGIALIVTLAISLFLNRTIHGIIIAIIVSLLFGFLFANRLIAYTSALASTNINNATQTQVVANLWRGVESVGGKMTITKEAITFEPHNDNIQLSTVTIPIRTIQQVKKRNSLFVIPNGLTVYTANDQYKFVLWNRDEVLAVITKLMN